MVEPKSIYKEFKREWRGEIRKEIRDRKQKVMGQRSGVVDVEDDARSINKMEKLCPSCHAQSSQIICTRGKNKATEQKQKV